MEEENNDFLNLIIRENVPMKFIEKNIYSVISDEQNINSFDEMANFYDKVICSYIYNRIVWGYSISIYGKIVKSMLENTKSGIILDNGCGSLAFSSETYSKYLNHPVVFFDHSLSLL